MKQKKQKNKPLWMGRFMDTPDKIMQKINASINFDKRLYSQDIEASVAHIRMLMRQNIINKQECEDIVKGLITIKKEIEEDSFEFSDSKEDIHMHVESRLIELVGQKAKKLHTARSRNDQVATDIRLWVRDAIRDVDILLRDLQEVLINHAEHHYADFMPGFTHMQSAQPITLGHHLLAYVEMFGRDRGRFEDNKERLNECPLGAAALAGTSFNINRDITSSQLRFNRPMRNSIDAVSDRDFILETLSCCSISSIHLSRIAEEIVLWSTSNFNFINISDKFATGSSIMPQKKNPDAAELIRGKTGRIIGNLVSLSSTMKGLPLAYSKDMQEDKEPLFDTVDTLKLCLLAMTEMIKSISFNTRTMYKMSSLGYSTATDMADWLVRELKIPFRDAHKISGKIVALAEKRKCFLHNLTIKDLQKIEPKINESIFSVLSVKASVNSKNSYGGTSTKNVYNEIIYAKNKWL